MTKWGSFLIPVLLLTVFCVCLLVGCAVSATDPNRPSGSFAMSGSLSQSTAMNDIDGAAIYGDDGSEEFTAQQLEQFRTFVYNWYFFCQEPVSSPEELPKDSRMLRFICQQTWEQKLYDGAPLEYIGTQDWLVSLSASEVERMAMVLFGDAVDPALLPKTELSFSVDELEAQLENLSFATENYYLPKEDAFLSVAVYGLDLTALEPVEIYIDDTIITGVVRTVDGLERSYSFALDKDQFPFLTILSIN